MSNLTLSSPAFDDGESIPEKYGHAEADVNPPLEIGAVPRDAESLVLLVDDPDAVEPAGKVWDHWVVWNIPVDIATIPEDWDPDDALEGRNDFGDIGYGGPEPPDRPHTYRFRLYALDVTLDLSPPATKDEVESAIDGHVLAQARLEGTYAP